MSTSVVAAESREPVLQFKFAKSLTYRARLTWTLGLAAAGLALQVAFVAVLPGIPFLLAAAALSWVVGFDNRLDARGMPLEASWESVPFEKVEEVVRVDAAVVKWDRSAVDVSNGWGCLALGAALAAVIVLTVIEGAIGSEDAALIVAVDGAILLLAQWFSGMRTTDRRPDLVLKARHLAEVAGPARAEVEAAGGTLRAQLRMDGKSESRVPEDVRLAISFPAERGRMLTLQGQVVLNRVQGTPYPYFYAVVVATPGTGLLPAAEKLGDPDGLVVEPKAESDVEIAVIRQQTSRTSGYHTKPDVSRRILDAALGLAATLARGAEPAPA